MLTSLANASVERGMDSLSVVSQPCFTFSFQFELFKNIKPLFAKKPLLVVANKCDVKRVSELSEESQALFKEFEEEGIPLVETSTVTEEGVMKLKTEVSLNSIVPCCKPQFGGQNLIATTADLALNYHFKY